MVEEGYGFEQEDGEEVVEEGDEDEDKEIDDNLDKGEEPSDYDLKELVKERTKIINEINVVIPPLKESIGRINLDLFGDPMDTESFWGSITHVLEKEARNPYTAKHPIAQKILNFTAAVRKIQDEWQKLTEMDALYRKALGNLLDKTLNSFKAMEGKYQKQDTVKMPMETKDMTGITNGMVNKFLIKEEANKLIEDYIKAYEEGDYERCRQTKSGFASKGLNYFREFHQDSKYVTKMIWEKYVGDKPLVKEILAKKKG